jgi:hypothetical protein
MLLPGSAIADLLLLEVSGCVVTPENLGAQDEMLSISLSLWQWAGASKSDKYNAKLLHLPKKIWKPPDNFQTDPT